MRVFSKLAILAWVLSLAPWAGAQGQFPFQNPSLPLEQRVDDLVARLTLDEKVSQTTGTAAAIPRLGIPEYTWWNEALHGVALAGYATVFPQAIGLAATWDTDLIHRVADTISTEARAKNADALEHGNRRIFFGLTFWSPNINIFRDPRWGRGQETYGEDPYLTSRIGQAFVSGLQGDDPKYLKVVATPKHFAVHSGPELVRNEFNVNPSPRDLEATYLPAFRFTVVGAHAASIMCAYNAIDGDPACANRMLLDKTLRQDWAFQGFVTSDCGAVTDIWQTHKFTSDEEHAAALALRAGTDTSCGTEFAALKKAVQDKLVSESEIDVAVKRLFTARFRLGMFDPPQSTPYGHIPISDNDSEAHRALALETARKSMVLLKNAGGTLPLSAKVRTIAVIGPNAADLTALEGNYHATPSHSVLPLEGIEARLGSHAKILYAQGSSYAAGFPVTVPETAFHHGGKPGLAAEYFDNAHWTGKPAVGRVDKQVDFDWNAVAPVPGIDAAAFSVRWTGTITPPAAGQIPFEVALNCKYPRDNSGTETYRLYLDEKLIDSDSCEARTPKDNRVFPVQFPDSQPHSFRLEYAHEAPMFDAGISLQWRPDAAAEREQAVALAKQADVIVAFMGLSSRLEGEEMRSVHLDGFAGGDRTKIDLPQEQQDLLDSLVTTGKPLVLVLLNGSAIALPWAQEHAAAILEAWYPGEEGGRAIAETLAGDINPAGRLPVTFYASLDQLPPFEDYSMNGRTYRYFSGKPLYGFGYGLSYTTFVYRNLKLSSSTIHAGEPLIVEADVTNTGTRAGDEVAELYLRGPQTAGAPLRSLRAFDRIAVSPGETRHVRFSLDARSLSEADDRGIRAVWPGGYSVFVGGGQPGEASGVEGQFAVEGLDTLPR